MIPMRVYVEVRAVFSEYGELRPVHIKWSDGRVFEVDAVKEIRRAPSSAGSAGVRYTVKVSGHERYLFYEDIYSETGKPRWFVEQDGK